MEVLMKMIILVERMSYTELTPFMSGRNGVFKENDYFG